MKAIQTLAQKVGWFDVVLTTGIFSGYAPVAPGTWGTVVAIPLYLLLIQSGWFLYILAALVLFYLGMKGADKIEFVTKQKDNGFIVIDEIVGYLVTMLFLPQNWLFAILGFFVFRFFDILKPYPIRKLDHNPNLKGFGVMIDDVLAGVYGNIVLQIAARFV